MKSVKIDSNYQVIEPIKVPKVKNDEVLVVRIGSEDIQQVQEQIEKHAGKKSFNSCNSSLHDICSFEKKRFG
jgi:nicotinic acid phosphoribosyltransferase